MKSKEKGAKSCTILKRIVQLLVVLILGGLIVYMVYVTLDERSEFQKAFSNIIEKATPGQVLGFVGAGLGALLGLVASIGTYLSSLYLANKQEKLRIEEFEKETQRQLEYERPILIVVESNGTIDVSNENKSIDLKLVNVGLTPAINVRVEAKTDISKYFPDYEASDGSTIFSHSYDVIMPGDSVKLPIFSADKISQEFPGDVYLEMPIDYVIRQVSKNQRISLDINITGKDRFEKSIKEIKKMMNLNVKNLQREGKNESGNYFIQLASYSITNASIDTNNDDQGNKN